jgi:hypothetical protein
MTRSFALGYFVEVDWMRLRVGFEFAVLVMAMFIAASTACFAVEENTANADEKSTTCTEGGTCIACSGACEAGCLDEWWMVERYIGDELVDEMGVQPVLGKCVFAETGPQGGEPTVQAYFLSYPLDDETLKMDLTQSERWFKGEIPDYGAIYVKQVDPNEHWIFRFGDREVTATKSFDPTITHTYNVIKIVDGTETVWNETTISEGSFATLSFNDEPIIILATTGSEGTRLPEDLVCIKWLVFNCGEFGIVYVKAFDDIDAIEVEIEGTRYYPN